LGDAGPEVVAGRAVHLEDFENLVDLAVADEERFLLDELVEDAAY